MTTAVVLAAGMGTRMKSELPKVLMPVCGRPMIEHVLDALANGGVDRVIAVVGYRADLVRAAVDGRPGVEFALQTEQLGTTHKDDPGGLGRILRDGQGNFVGIAEQRDARTAANQRSEHELLRIPLPRLARRARLHPPEQRTGGC